MSSALTKTTIGDKVAYKGIAFHMATSVDCDGIVIIAADADALHRSLRRLGIGIEPNMLMCPKVMLTADKEQA